MVRKAITIISLLLSVLMPTYASAQKIEVTKDYDYILYVKDIGLPDSVIIYGQPKFINAGEHYGGNRNDYFRSAYAKVNDSITGLSFGRDENGIFFKMPASADIDSVDITLVVAEYRKGKGWCPTDSNLQIVWWLRENPLTTVTNLEEPADSIQAKNGGGETVTDAPSPWHISNIDWVLLILIVLLTFATLFVSKQPQKKNEDKEKAAEDSKSEIANLKRLIANLIAANNNFTKAIGDLASRYNTLESDIQKLHKKDKLVNTDKITSENIQVTRPIHPAQPVNLGSVRPVAGEKALAINSYGSGFFQLTRNINGQVTFTLIDNPEVRNFFETNPSMLEIYRTDGIISYDNIPNNSHVFVECMGIAKETGSGKYEVVSPLKLIFK